MKNKNIIFISSQKVFNPSSGTESRINNLLKILYRNNSIIILGPKQKLKKCPKNFFGFEYKSKFNKILDTRILKKGYELNKQNRIDLIYATTLWSGLNGLILGLATGKPYYFDNHNVEFLRFKRSGSLLWPLVYIYEGLLCKFAKKIICVSETDKKYLIKYFKLNSEKIKVIENSVDTSIFYPNSRSNKYIRQELGLKNNEKMILFFGQLDYRPNIEALEIIRDKIIPNLEKRKEKYKIVICGVGDGKGLLKKFKHNNLIFKGFVDRIQDYINASDVVIAPLKSGSGTRIKILESLACKKSVISTSIGVEGINKNIYGDMLLIADDWDEFCNKIVTLIKNPKKIK